MKVVSTHWLHPKVTEYLQRFADLHAPAEVGVVWSRKYVISQAHDADAVITCMADSIDEAFLTACPKVQIIAATLKGYDNYDVDACTRHRTWLSIVPDIIIAPTAELGLSLTLAILRNVRQGDEIVRKGEFIGWRPQLYGSSLAGSVVGIIGMGNLGKAIANLLGPFKISKMLYVDAQDHAAPEIPAPASSQRVDLSALLSQSNVIIVTLPLTPATRHLIGEEMLSKLQPGSYLINVGRGSVVNEQAVLDALDRGLLGGYAADVFEFEDWMLSSRPSSVSAALRQHPKTIFTPHLGSAVNSVREEMSLTAARQVFQALHGETPEHAVNSPSAR